VVLIPLSILASALSDLMLGTIFFNMSRLAPEDALKGKDKQSDHGASNNSSKKEGL